MMKNIRASMGIEYAIGTKAQPVRVIRVAATLTTREE